MESPIKDKKKKKKKKKKTKIDVRKKVRKKQGDYSLLNICPCHLKQWLAVMESVMKKKPQDIKSRTATTQAM